MVACFSEGCGLFWNYSSAEKSRRSGSLVERRAFDLHFPLLVTLPRPFSRLTVFTAAVGTTRARTLARPLVTPLDAHACGPKRTSRKHTSMHEYETYAAQRHMQRVRVFINMFVSCKSEDGKGREGSNGP